MVFIFSAIIFFLSTIALLSSSAALLVSDKIFYGVKVEDVPLGGLSVDEAANKLERLYDKNTDGKTLIELKADDKNFKIDAADIDLTVDFKETAQKAFEIGRADNMLQNIYDRVATSQKGVVLAYETHFDENKLNNKISAIRSQTISPKKDARLEMNGQDIKVVPEITGKELNSDELAASLKNSIVHLKLPLSINLPLAIDNPDVKADDLSGINCVLAAYSSTFNAANTNRSENIRIAAASINNLLLRPQDIISFNKIVGPRIVEAGFKEAPVIIEGKTVPDIGGGVCQVSSTLYNAILLADMQPVERSPHFHPLGYVPIGLDATVADNLIDFKFKNSRRHAAYVLTLVQNGTLTVFILGSSDDLSDYKINLVSHIDKILDPKVVIQYDDTLPAGKRIISDEGMKGYIVSSYRVKTRNGEEISRELLYTDEYTPEDQIVIFGTMLPKDDGTPQK
jgi:vancomycin resistance protein YoaR